MITNTRFIILCLLIIVTGLYINFHSDINVPTNRPFREFPLVMKGWKMLTQSSFTEAELRVLKPTDYIYREYSAENRPIIQLYIGYHGGGKDSGPIHSPKHCLPGGGWFKLEETKTGTIIAGTNMNIIKAVYQKGDGKTMFLYWYQVKGRSLTDEYSLRLAEILNSLLYRRRDSAFIRISVPFDHDEERVFKAGVQFINDFYPSIQEFLPK
jgi:EpsI family protein